MAQQKKTSSAAAKTPKKLIPRTAPKPEVLAPVSDAAPAVVVPVVVAASPAPTPATAAAARQLPASKAVTEAVTEVAAEALPAAPAVAATPAEKAAATPIKQPLGKPVKAGKPAKAEKPAKPKKVKLVRDSYAMPEAEYAQIASLKKRLAGLSVEVKKSELLRGGIAALAALDEAELQAVMGRIERIKTGRPAK